MPLSSGKKEAILAFYRAGNSMSRTAKEFEVSKATVHALCAGIEQDLSQRVNGIVSTLSTLDGLKTVERQQVMTVADEKLRAEGVYLQLAKRSNKLLSTAQKVIERKVKADDELVLEFLPQLQTVASIAEKNRKIEGLEPMQTADDKTASVNIQINFV